MLAVSLVKFTDAISKWHGGKYVCITPPAANPKEQPQPVVGRDVPDESKERHTEIAVEAGRQNDSKKGEKSR